VRSSEGVEGAIARALDEFGRVDILVANAGIARAVPLDG
jgi:NAD(P)-dependent dehydrogenase (short-subunit alcohol dehydrogenase family)